MVFLIQHAPNLTCIRFVFGLIGRFVYLVLIFVLAVVTGFLGDALTKMSDALVVQGRKVTAAQERSSLEHLEYHQKKGEKSCG